MSGALPEVSPDLTVQETSPGLTVRAGTMLRSTGRRIPRRYLGGLLGVVLALAAWQLLAGAVIRSPNLPLATSTLGRLSSLAGTGAFWSAVWETLVTAATGFLVSLPIAIALGVVMGMSVLAYRALQVVVEVLKPIPPIVILPLVLLKLGSTERMAEILILFTVIPSLIVIVAAGVRDTDPVALSTARSFRLGRWARVRRIVLPSALPFVATGLRISIAAAVITAVLAEIVAGAPGLGDQVNMARSAGDTTATFAYVVALGILGIVMTYLLNHFERHALRWHVSVRGTHPEAQGHGLFSALRQRMAGTALWEGARAALDEAADRAAVLRQRLARPVNAQLSRAGQHARRLRPSPARDRPARRTRKVIGPVIEVAVPLGLLAAWWAWSAQAHSLYYPPASKIFTDLQKTWFFAHFTSDALPSLENLALGLLIGCVIGVAIGIVMAELPFLGDMLDPVIVFFRSIPGVAYVPIMIILIGFTAPMRIASIALASLFPVLIATFDGLRGIDSMISQVSRAYALSWWRRLIFVRLPAAAPRIASGLEISIAVAVVVMVASELQGTAHGIGAQTILAEQNFDITGMWSGIVLLAILGVAVSFLFRGVRLRVLRWYYRSRPDATPG